MLAEADDSTAAIGRGLGFVGVVTFGFFSFVFLGCSIGSFWMASQTGQHFWWHLGIGILFLTFATLKYLVARGFFRRTYRVRGFLPASAWKIAVGGTSVAGIVFLISIVNGDGIPSVGLAILAASLLGLYYGIWRYTQGKANDPLG